MVYNYFTAVLAGTNKFRRRSLLHFAPGLLYLVYSLGNWLADTLDPARFNFYADGRDRDLATWYQIAGLLPLAIYTVGVYRNAHYRRFTTEEFSYADSITFTWVQQCLIALFVLVCLRLGFLLAYPGFGNFGQPFWYYLSYGLVVGALAIYGYTSAVRSGSLALSLTVRERAEA